MSTTFTQRLGSFISNLGFDELPDTAIATAKRGMIDCIGVMVAGSGEPNVVIIDQCFRQVQERQEARLFFTDERVSAALAAMLNGVASHVLDYDDVAEPLGGHPSTVLVPAILAEADALPGITGRDMLRAYVAGYEVWAEVIGRDRDSHHMKGWHPTSVFGVLGAAASCAALRRLSAGHATHALGIAASLASGLVSNFGSMTKSLHAGHAAQAGVLASRLASAGLTSAPDAIEHPRGLLVAASLNGKIDLSTPVESPRRNWRIVNHGLGIKKYPMCYATHRTIDGLADLVREHSVAPEDIEQIIVLIGEKQAAILRNHCPQTALEAKFSIEFAVAATLVAGRIGFAELSDPFVRRQDVQGLMTKVEVATLAQEVANHEAIFSPYDQVTLKLKNGQVLHGRQVNVARGDPLDPLSLDDLWLKFRDCLRHRGYSNDMALQLFSTLERLETVTAAQALPTLAKR